MWTRESLIDHLAHGGTAEFLFFWGHTPKQANRVDASGLLGHDTSARSPAPTAGS